MDKKTFEKISSAFFAENLMTSFMSQLDEALVSRVLNLRHRIDEAMNRFEGTKDQISKIQEKFSTNSEELKNAFETLRRVSSEMQSQLSKSGASLDQVSEKFKDILDKTSRTLESFGEIERMIEQIVRIAKQTNLLALNASIEAARAGEHGRGFAIVASEIQKLAGESNRTTQEITQKVKHLSEMVQSSIEGLKIVADLFNIFKNSTERMLSFLQQNAELISKTSVTFDQTSESLSQQQAVIKETYEVLKSAEEKFEAMLRVINSVVKAQQKLKDLKL
ncbi:methyl-accepting chemotaxis protein [Pseudothermotoga sp.]|nr:methyl-accepting chemotaxis protein [Pseudothermotoga sp.]MCX7812562.1 methyl-accepting chemotaxis protein [Pseudothermotoga sp.]MDW8138841.1 methyl-accepting chemotaxis protein [Pseudothermotoga sp.]